MKRLVQKLRGCLAALPPKLSLVLELSTGVGVPHELPAGGVAGHLHVSLNQLEHLESSALVRLRRLASTEGCANAAQPTPALLFGTVGGVVSPEAGGGASGGVDAVRYAKSPSPEPFPPLPSAGSGSDSLLGVISRRGENEVLWLVIGIGGMLFIASLFASGPRVGPQLALWRHRWISAPFKSLLERFSSRR